MSYQGVGVFSLLRGEYDGRPFEVQAYQCPCGVNVVGASCMTKVAVSLNTSEASCTAVVNVGESFAMDNWGSVQLTSGGVFITLPAEMQSLVPPQLTGLLVTPPHADAFRRHPDVLRGGAHLG